MIDKDSAEQALRPYFADLRACIVGGFKAWMELGRVAPALRVPCSTRTRAGFIYDHIVSCVRATFAGRRSVRIIEKRGFLELVIKNRFVLRFKKLDAKGRSRNILTRQQRLWFEQQLTLPEMPPEAEKLIAGYVLDELGTEIHRVLVTQPASATAVDWLLGIDGDDTNIIPMPRTPRKPKAPSVRSTKKRTSERDGDESA